MMRITLLLFISGCLGGCTSISHPLPKCDGYSRRQLNRSMWQWEDVGAVRQSSSEIASATSNPVASYAEEPVSDTPAAFKRFDVENSYRNCGGQ
ncbi:MULTISPECIES: hypothetical protein [unclassified Sinorhizobium]|uniref:hypothetical protein n=1 Tax=unclassified Sinorhizobium TaxID=2613772 RepID=UPI0035241C48